MGNAGELLAVLDDTIVMPQFDASKIVVESECGDELFEFSEKYDGLEKTTPYPTIVALTKGLRKLLQVAERKKLKLVEGYGVLNGLFSVQSTTSRRERRLQKTIKQLQLLRGVQMHLDGDAGK